MVIDLNCFEQLTDFTSIYYVVNIAGKAINPNA